MAILDRIRNAWNTFKNRDPTYYRPREYGPTYATRPDRVRFARSNERTIVNSIYNRIAMDVCSIEIKHVRTDEDGRYLETIESGLNNCFNLEANIDQTGRAFVQDIVMSMLDEGCVAVVPIDTDVNPDNGDCEIFTMRTGRILEWSPQHVRANVYNDRTGEHEEVIVPKASTGIMENPLHSVMNEPNSTIKRLVRKLNLLDAVDEQTSSGKLDLIIQLPYIIKTDIRKQQAEMRRKDIERQLTEGKYGIAYTDGTERITQLNRPVENNLMAQIEYLTNQVYSQLGMSQDILNGTADEKEMLNYNNRIIEPFLSVIVDEVKRKFLTETARSNRETIMFFRDPFKLVPINDIAEIADKFTRNEIMSSNEIRQIVGRKPSKDPEADQLRNKNLSEPADRKTADVSEEEPKNNENKRSQKQDG